jgi:hypothetical protein
MWLLPENPTGREHRFSGLGTNMSRTVEKQNFVWEYPGTQILLVVRNQ